MTPFDPAAAIEVSDVERRISELWREEGPGEEARMRACTLNLVVPCEDASAIGPLVETLSEHHPCRAIVVSCDGSPGARAFRAWVSAHGHVGFGGRRTYSEQVTIEARGDAVQLVPETILQLLCEDLPVYTWWRRSTLASDPLLAPIARLSDRLLVDSSLLEDPAAALVALAAVATEPSFRGRVTDLAWTRLEPWRSMVASLFDAPAMQPLLGDIVSLSVCAGGPVAPGAFTAAGAYLGAWLASRLGWTVEAGHVRAPGGRDVEIRWEHDPALGRGEIGSVRIACRGEAGRTELAAARTCPGGDLVRLPGRVLKLPARDEIALVSGEIEWGGREPVFESALWNAVRLPGAVS